MTYNEILSAGYISRETSIQQPTLIWNDKFNQLQLFLKEHGWEVLKDNISLYKWSTQQRVHFNKKVLLPSAFQKLQSIGFIWDSVMFRWDNDYVQLAAYYEQNNGKEPQYIRNNPNNPISRLGLFVIKARMNKKKASLNSYQLEKLKELKHFTFKADHRTWFNRIEIIKQKLKSSESKSLNKLLNATEYCWIFQQWDKFNENGIRLSSLQIDSLKTLNLSSYFNRWDNYLELLNQYVEVHNELPARKKNRKLHDWLKRQIIQQLKGNLSSKQEYQLKKLGIDFSLRRTKLKNDMIWKEFFHQYEIFIVKYDCEPTLFTDPKLYSWVQANRQVMRGTAKNRKPLAQWKVDLLNSVRFECWNKRYRDKKNWHRRFEQLQEYLASSPEISLYRNGNLKLKKLYEWLRRQKRSYDKGTLSYEFIQEFEAIGIRLNENGIIKMLSNYNSRVK